MAQKNATGSAHAHTHTYTHTACCSLVYLTAPSSLHPWVGWGLQCCPRPAWPLQAPPEFPPSTGYDVTCPAPGAVGVCPSPGSRVWGAQREEDWGPSTPWQPTNLQRPSGTPALPSWCDPAANGSSQGRTPKWGYIPEPVMPWCAKCWYSVGNLLVWGLNCFFFFI